MVEFQNKLEDNIYSKVISSYADKDAEGMARLYDLYKCIQKESKFMQVLSESRSKSIIEEWDTFDIGMHISFESSFVNWITKFLTKNVFESLVIDSNWVISVIPNSYNFQMDYLAHIFIKLGPEIHERVLKMYDKNKSFSGIKDLYEACVSFGSSVEKYLLPLENNTNVDIGETGKWGLDLFKSFIPFQIDYAEHERRAALDYLSVAISDNKKANNYLVFYFNG